MRLTEFLMGFRNGRIFCVTIDWSNALWRERSLFATHWLHYRRRSTIFTFIRVFERRTDAVAIVQYFRRVKNVCFRWTGNFWITICRLVSLVRKIVCALPSTFPFSVYTIDSSSRYSKNSIVNECFLSRVRMGVLQTCCLNTGTREGCQNSSKKWILQKYCVLLLKIHYAGFFLLLPAPECPPKWRTLDKEQFFSFDSSTADERQINFIFSTRLFCVLINALFVRDEWNCVNNEK